MTIFTVHVNYVHLLTGMLVGFDFAQPTLQYIWNFSVVVEFQSGDFYDININIPHPWMLAKPLKINNHWLKIVG